MAGDLLGGVLI